LCRERLIDDVGKGSRYLNSVLCLSRADKAGGIVDILRRKLRRTSSYRLGERGAMFRAKSRYSTNSLMGGSSYITSGLASIKLRKNLLLL
jgi:hypothetical protein